MSENILSHMGGSDVVLLAYSAIISALWGDVWSGGIVGLFGRPVLCCAILCACPLDAGFFCVFSDLFRLPNVG